MATVDDRELLSCYRRSRDEQAFAELVRRHGDWVYAMARRQLGDAHLAEDVTQAVFLLLARKSAGIRAESNLGPWLFGVTRYCVREAIRGRASRRRRETEAAQMRHAEEQPAPAVWEMIAPVLDDAVGQLRRGDREAIHLRFYQRKSLAEVGRLLGISEEAARKRVDRAVERLRQALTKSCSELDAGSLAGLVAAHAATPGPVGMLERIASNAIGGRAQGSAATIAQGARKGMTMMALKTLGVAGILCGVACVAAAQLASAASPATAAATAPATQPAAPGADLRDLVRERYLASRKAVETLQCDYTFKINNALLRQCRYRRSGDSLYHAGVDLLRGGGLGMPSEVAWDGKRAYRRIAVDQLVFSSRRGYIRPSCEVPEDGVGPYTNYGLNIGEVPSGKYTFLSARPAHFKDGDVVELKWSVNKETGAPFFTVTALHDPAQGYWPVAIDIVYPDGSRGYTMDEVRYTSIQSDGKQVFYPVHIVARADPDRPNSNHMTYTVDEKTLQINKPIPIEQFQIATQPCDIVTELETGKTQPPTDREWSPVGKMGFPWDKLIVALQRGGHDWRSPR